MDNSVIEKKFKKISSKELRVKLSRGLLSTTEVEIVTGILSKRENGESYRSPDFEKESQKTVSDILKKQLELPEETVASTHTQSHIRVKSDTKIEKKVKVTRVVFTEEVSANIKKVVDEFKGSKKELVVYLLENGFTKQQLDKYRPEIAHWSYIYDVARNLGK